MDNYYYSETMACDHLFQAPFSCLGYCIDEFDFKTRAKAIVGLALSPLALVGIALNVIIGTVTGIAGIIFCQKSMHKYSEKLLTKSKQMTIIPRGILALINPALLTFESEYANGPFTDSISVQIFKNHATDCANDKNNCFKRHVISRLTFLLFGVSSIITRIFDLILGALAFPFAIIYLGDNENLNYATLGAFNITAIVSDVAYSVLRFISPTKWGF